MLFRSATLSITLLALVASSTPSLAHGSHAGDAAAAPAPITSGALPTATGVLPPPTTGMYPGYGSGAGGSSAGGNARAPNGSMKVVVTHNGQEYAVTVPAVPGLSGIPCCGESDGLDPSDNDEDGIFCRQLRAELAKVPACSSLAAAGAIDADLMEEDEAPPAAGAGTSDEVKPAVQPPTGGKIEVKKPAGDNAAGGKDGQQVLGASSSSALARFQASGAHLVGTIGAGLMVAGVLVAL